LNKIADFLKRTFSESGGALSSVRILLGAVVGMVVALVVYTLVRHALKHEAFDVPPNLANLLSVVTGTLAGAKAWQKSAEDQPPQ
jgi:NhaP-type Na+/H+ or K+/H+ antiporter